ncbi:EmrB/QacA family drug resistance transporter [Sphingorhabdus lutea]|uniref:EmrB/QacA family drug resistance transporter n=1 Tax=Sphingorhabdus lutea TaxID=1913578 RepID=A0A1L3JEE1_9SPHN|nr:EmrB/QacA family drug resistance transporter [Sphingorhabdus lutea]
MDSQSQGGDYMPPQEKADISAWMGVAAGALGSLMATLDISIVNASLPTIQGEIGASTSEGTWVATAYLVAEIIVIPLTGWLERVFGLRRFLLIAAILFTGFSIMCGLADNLGTMIIGRVGQGFTGGAMIPTAMTIIATRLPPSQQPIGTAIFGATVILGPVLGPLLGGWLTENLSWHYAFFINVPVSILLIALLIFGLPNDKMNLDELKSADWLGIIGMSLGLGGLTIVLEDGHKEQWFESALIWQLTILTIIGFALMALGQFYAKKPVIKLALLRNREFAAVSMMALILGGVLYGTSYIIPQFLAAIADYNALQAGQVVFLAGVPSLLMMPFVPFLIRSLDLRLAVALGFGMLAFSSFWDAALTAQSTGPDFTESQLMRGVGQILGFMFLNQAAISAVKMEDAGDAAGLFNAARNLGGSVTLALLATLQDTRWQFHRWNLHANLQQNDAAAQNWLSSLTQQFGGGEEGLTAAYHMIDAAISRDALVMAFNDEFWLMTVGTLLIIPLVLFLKPLPKGQINMAMH